MTFFGLDRHYMSLDEAAMPIYWLLSLLEGAKHMGHLCRSDHMWYVCLLEEVLHMIWIPLAVREALVCPLKCPAWETINVKFKTECSK